MWAESALSTGGRTLALPGDVWERRVPGSTVGVAGLRERPRTAQEGGAGQLSSTACSRVLMDQGQVTALDP